MRFIALVIALLSAAVPAAAEIALGEDRYYPEIDGYEIPTRTYRPDCPDPDIVFVHHGSGRDSADYLRYSMDLAEKECLVAFAPLFNSSDFSNDEYQRANLEDNLDSPDEWSTRYEEGLVEWAADDLPGDQEVYLFGHSAGGQYLIRVAAYDPVPGVARYVVANPSTWVMPSLEEDFPYGFGAMPDGEARLREYLAQPITVYLGEDDDRDDGNMAVDRVAMRQGDDRRERGEYAFELGQRLAEEHGWPFNWRLVVAPGVAHSAGEMLRSRAADDAFGFDDPAPQPQPEPEQPQECPVPSGWIPCPEGWICSPSG